MGASVASLAYQEVQLPLQLPLTTGSSQMTHQVIRLQLRIADTTGNVMAEGYGEAAPLPGDLQASPLYLSGHAETCICIYTSLPDFETAPKEIHSLLPDRHAKSAQGLSVET